MNKINQSINTMETRFITLNIYITKCTYSIKNKSTSINSGNRRKKNKSSRMNKCNCRRISSSISRSTKIIKILVRIKWGTKSKYNIIYNIIFTNTSNININIKINNLYYILTRTRVLSSTARLVLAAGAV